MISPAALLVATGLSQALRAKSTRSRSSSKTAKKAVHVSENYNDEDLLQHMYSDESVVFNPFSAGYAPVGSRQFTFLEKIGICVVDRELAVVDSGALRAFAERFGNLDQPALDAETVGWPPKMRRDLEAMIVNHPVDTIVETIAGYLRSAYSTVNARKRKLLAEGRQDQDLKVVEKLTSGQQQVLSMVLAGRNVFIAGVAGTGKSALLMCIINELRKKDMHVAVTATTGVAAAAINGLTFHSFVGVTHQGDVNGRDPLERIDVLIVDEVSFLSSAMLDGLDKKLREMRNSSKVFGGVQMIFSGDPMQLECIPPVTTFVTADGTRHSERRAARHKNFFESTLIHRDFVRMALTEQVRQAGDQPYSAGLNELRRGRFTDELSSMINMVDKATPIEQSALVLFGRNSEVVAYNNDKLDKLPGERITISALPQTPTLMGEWSSSVLLEVPRDDFDNNQFLDQVHSALCQGQHGLLPKPADVVGYPFLQNGFVVRVRLPPSWPEPDQLALKNRFARLVPDLRNISSQPIKVFEVSESGDGMPPLEVDTLLSQMSAKGPMSEPLELKVGARVMLRQNFTRDFVNGHTGEVVGFVEAKEGNIPGGIQNGCKWTSEALEQYIEGHRLTQGVAVPVLPLVKFDHKPDAPLVVPPSPVVVGGCPLTHYYQMSTIVLPLTLAYSSTVHKAQGMTIYGDVRFCAENLWPCNHLVYVAMSRVRRAGQITVSGFRDELVRVNEDALRFDADLVPATSYRMAPEDMLTMPIADWHLTAVEREKQSETPSSKAAATVSQSPVLKKANVARVEEEKRQRQLGVKHLTSAMQAAASRSTQASVKALKARKSHRKELMAHAKRASKLGAGSGRSNADDATKPEE